MHRHIQILYNWRLQTKSWRRPRKNNKSADMSHHSSQVSADLIWEIVRMFNPEKAGRRNCCKNASRGNYIRRKLIIRFQDPKMPSSWSAIPVEVSSSLGILTTWPISIPARFVPKDWNSWSWAKEENSTLVSSTTRYLKWENVRFGTITDNGQAVGVSAAEGDMGGVTLITKKTKHSQRPSSNIHKTTFGGNKTTRK